jgi:hypothetical protein
MDSVEVPPINLLLLKRDEDSSSEEMEDPCEVGF